MEGLIGGVDVLRKFAHSAARWSTLAGDSPHVTGEARKISVILDSEEAERFDAYCKEMGFKKSSLAARLIREHLDHEGYRIQKNLFQRRPEDGPKR